MKKINVTEKILGENGDGGKYYERLQKACNVIAVGHKKKEVDNKEEKE